MTTAEQLASQARKAREATLRRDELIRAMRAEGASLRTIAGVAGLSHMAISKILARYPTTDELDGGGDYGVTESV